MTCPDLSHLSSEDKDALILPQLDRVAAFEAKLGGPSRTPNNSSVPLSRGQKGNRPPRPKKPRRKRDGPGVTRALATDPDRTADCHARTCVHCGTALGTEGQHLRHVYDHIDLPPIQPVVTRVRIFGRRCPGCHLRVRGDAGRLALRPVGGDDAGLPAPSHAVGYDRLSGLMADLFGLSISEGAIAIALCRSRRALERAGAVIVERLRSATVIGCDETGARLTIDTLGTRMGWEWVLVSDTAVLHRIRTSRGRDVVTDVLEGHRPRCWVSDRWGAQ